MIPTEKLINPEAQSTSTLLAPELNSLSILSSLPQEENCATIKEQLEVLLEQYGYDAELLAKKILDSPNSIKSEFLTERTPPPGR